MKRIVDSLSHPAWQGIAGIIAIVALIFSVLIYYFPNSGGTTTPAIATANPQIVVTQVVNAPESPNETGSIPPQASSNTEANRSSKEFSFLGMALSRNQAALAWFVLAFSIILALAVVGNRGDFGDILRTLGIFSIMIIIPAILVVACYLIYLTIA